MAKIPVHQIIISDIEDVDVNSILKINNINNFFSVDKYQHMIWTNDLIVDHIKNHFDSKVFEAYESLIPNAYKSDLARFCILYIYGGWYLDATMRVNSVPPDMSNYDMFLVRDFYEASVTLPWQIANGLIYSIAGHEIFKIIIDRIVDNCVNKKYGRNSLSVSGPELFGGVIAEYGHKDINTKYYLGEFAYDKETGRKIFFYDNIKFVIAKKMLGGITNIPGGNNYAELWDNKAVYKEI